MTIRILLADDYAMVRQGFRALLEREGIRVVAEAADGREAVRLACELRPDVAVLDLAMPLLNGLEAAREIRRQAPATGVVLLTVHTEDRNVLEALQAGVRGYVVKSQPLEDLRAGIEAVARGSTYLSPVVSGAVVDAYLASGQPTARPLTARERQVLQLVAEGKTTKEVAALLGVSVKTSESHRTRLMHKLGLHNTADLVRYAIREGFVSP